MTCLKSEIKSEEKGIINLAASAQISLKPFFHPGSANVFNKKRLALRAKR